MRKGRIAPMLGGAVAAGVVASSIVKFHRQRVEADRLWRDSVVEPFAEPTSVKELTILPLIDFYTAGENLLGEPGVSYLIRADDHTTLFDVGLNQKGLSPSPLLRNMEALGVSREEIDSVVISHRHVDHTGGFKAQKGRTFMLTPDDPQPLPVKAYVPEEMTHSSAQVEVVKGPLEIAPGVFSIGPIARSIWLLGMTQEQALAVNVEGKGIVLIIGCGHQTLERAMARTESLFDAPLHGVVGGLHLPVTKSRVPFGIQRYIGTGKLPWQRITRAEVQATAEHLRQKDPKLVGLSAHDSCDWSVAAFKETFADRYEDVIVGREITV
jgi:7,8-dihydropterin-6-yl-methyl-4-(beta-D-ribofuranosyl)aminobenzene 5'-phosphate synthase